jgi:glutamate synthase domain-containing protein 3
MIALLVGPILYRVLDLRAADARVELYNDPLFHHKLYLDDFFPASFHNVWSMIAFAILGAFFLKGLCDYLGNYLVNYAGFSAVTNLRNTVFEKVLKQGAEFFESHSTGKLMSSIMNDIDKVQLATSHILADFLRQSFALICLLLVVIGKDPQLALLSFLVLPLVILPVTRIGKRIRRTTHRTQDRQRDLSQILHQPDVPPGVAVRCVQQQDHGLEKALDNHLIELARPALERRQPVQIEMPIRNVNRTVCTMLSAEISRQFGMEGLPPETVKIKFTGSAGQSFCAFMANGLAVTLEGDANDYFGKGLSGGRVVVYPPKKATFPPEENIIVGNVSLYGATGGEVFLRGLAGERFCVRNSGVTAVVEGVGDHGCEYMTRGVVVVLGRTGRNFAAGMSGGVAYVLDDDGTFKTRCNLDMVEIDPLDEQDAEAIQALVRRHYEYTQSAVAWRVLSGWKQRAQQFVKVMPIEYRQVLAKQHLDSDAARVASI